ncbi:MAG: UvrD-helicase domain-containing protein [Lachnospiraceae bacterium]|nr:UvrD-helicase domain-containing protein [Lachnospiraceae bacterium]
MTDKWTDEQRAVIQARNCGLLVSAAAGSGKTAVLVERILGLITDPRHPVDVDRLLVVTFTSAAAGEMRERIRGAIEAKLQEDPSDELLQRQITLVQHARITTIHSFCLDVIRDHFHEIGLDPAMRMADEGETKLLKKDAAAALLEEKCEDLSGRYRRFAECFAPGRTDEVIADLIIRFYDYSMAYPWPSEWRRSCLDAYRAQTPEELEGSAWVQLLVKDTAQRVLSCVEKLKKARDITLLADGPWAYEDQIVSSLRIVSALTSCSTYASFYRAFSVLESFPAFSKKKQPEASEEKKAQVKALRNEVKETIASLRKSFLYDTQDILVLLSQCLGNMEELAELTDLFEEKYTAVKRDKDLLDFNDLEQMALSVLVRREDGELVPTDAAGEYADRYEAVMVDEYQDSNLVQEIITSVVSREHSGAPNRFLVGDVKQSIYRFRQARPDLFLEKYIAYASDGVRNRRIDLHRNFRSRPQVLAIVNRIFEKIMIPELGGISYDEDAALYPGRTFDAAESEDAYLPELWIVGNEDSADGGGEEDEAEETGNDSRETGDDRETGADTVQEASADDEEQLSAGERSLIEREAACAGARILSMVGHEMITDRETGEYRPVRFGDIAVLFRSLAGSGEVFTQVFSDMGIPSNTGSGTGYFSAPEVRVMLSLLAVLDNPRQDIPLAAVMRSPIGGFTDEELSAVRTGCRDQDFYTACAVFAQREDDADLAGRLKKFLADIDLLRDLVPGTSVQELLWRAMEVTGYGDHVLAMPGGRRRRANLDMLCEKAAAFEQGSYRGLFQFIRYIENLKKYEVDYGEETGTETADNVQLTTIHRSKGLEYPVVFVCGLGKKFNMKDTTQAILLHPQLGIGCDAIDEELRVQLPMPVKNVISRQIRLEDLGEELRILYVAMTRAREKLILTGSIKSFEKKMETWEDRSIRAGKKMSFAQASSAGCMLDWIVPALLKEDPAGLFVMHTLPGGLPETKKETGTGRDDMKTDVPVSLPEEDRIYDETVMKHFERIRSFSYPYEILSSIPATVSVSVLKKGDMEELQGHILPMFEEDDRIVPEFMKESPQEKQQLTGGPRLGTLYHRVMECFDFNIPFEGDFIETQLESMVNCDKILSDDREQIDPDVLRRFFESDLARRMQKASLAGKLHRETPFILGVPAREIYRSVEAEDMILVQGIVDAWFEEDAGIILLDYKTDRVFNGEELVRKYHIQLESYERALSELTGRKITEKYLYSFRLGEVIPV